MPRFSRTSLPNSTPKGSISVIFDNFPQRFGNALRAGRKHIHNVHSKPQRTRPGPTSKTQKMKTKLERLLNLGAAAVTLAAAFGLDPVAAALSSAAISVGFAVTVGLTR